MAPTIPAFQRLKAVCVPLLGSASLTPATIPKASQLLSQIIDVLRDLHASEYVLSESLINYTFFPISSILQLNKSPDIPNQILEKIFTVLALLCDDWWWTCDVSVWQQIFMLAGAILGDMEGQGQGRKRDDETKEAAARCLFALLRMREEDEEQLHMHLAEPRLSLLKEQARSPKFVPILGQTLNSLLTTTDAESLQLQLACLQVINVLLSVYFPDPLIPSVIPGVVSTATKLALNSKRKGWANGELTASALEVLAVIVVKSIGDDVCIRDGAIRPVKDLDDLANMVNDSLPPPSTDSNVPYGTSRTSSWLHGTTSQLHIALNALTPLVKHPTPCASIALVNMAYRILWATPTTLPQSQKLLLSFQLSLTLSDFPSVSSTANDTLTRLLQSDSRHIFVQVLMLHTRDNLLALPRLLPLMADAKVDHVAGLIEAVCRLGFNPGRPLNVICSEVARLLGPMGGVEKWGWSLLSVLEFVNPVVLVTSAPGAALMLERDMDANEAIPLFPEVTFRNVSLRSTYMALVRMFHALGRAAGDGCLFSVEWFAGVGQNGSGPRSVAAVWCACRLLEGCAGVDLMTTNHTGIVDLPRSKQLFRLARALGKSTSQTWNQSVWNMAEKEDTEEPDIATNEVQHLQGVHQVNATLNVVQNSSTAPRVVQNQPLLHKALLLQLIAICSGVLQARFSSLFMDCLYPVLHSLVSPVAFLSNTALASLSFITLSTSHASTANLLLSNFDYVLNAVSRRLTRRWLDVDATKVLVIMIRLVGDGVVERAGDIVEECFDRLDDYHGYEVLVEGLIEVLVEVTKVVKQEKEASADEPPARPRERPSQMPEFLNWYEQRLKLQHEDVDEDPGPAPREAWGKKEADEPQGEATTNPPDPDKVPPTPTQALTKQIVSRSLYFLTHHSPIIRARILTLLSSSVAVLPDNAILPSIHSAWPFILNRLSDSEQFVISAAAALIESLATNVGSFMYRRIWDDIWPRFKIMLDKLNASDSSNALARRGKGGVGTESAYTHSHRVYRSLLRTMTAAMRGVDPKDTSVWEVIVAFRRFLHAWAHEELQQCARELYIAVGENNADAVWLALEATASDALGVKTRSLRQPKWDIRDNVDAIFKVLDSDM